MLFVDPAVNGMLGPSIVQIGIGFTVSVPQPEPVQPPVIVTVTQYEPDVFTLIVDVVAPVLQRYPCAPLGDAVNVAEAPEHTVALFTVTVGFGFTVSVPQPEPVQFVARVTVTQYEPDALTLIVDVVAPVLQAYPCAPLGDAVSVAEAP